MPTRPRPPATLLLGLAVITAAEVLLFIDVAGRGGAVAPRDPIGDPSGLIGSVARAVALNMTPICWIGYLLLLDGLLEVVGGRPRDGSPLRRRPRRFAWCFVTSVPVWLLFDWVNFSFIHAWAYHGLPRSMAHRWTGYFLAFGAISPAMLLAAELVSRLGLARLAGPAVRVGPRAGGAVAAVGAACLALPFVLRDPIANLTLWIALPLLLDPVNRRLGAPSLLVDLGAGRWGRLVALMAGGLACGLLWELWNYWAIAKWTYDLPFLGPLEHVRYFEMPVPGLAGFLPFGPACWVAFNTILAGLRRVGLGGAEPLPHEAGIL
ncbi:MAG: hypothetical protein ACYTG1_03220 [Planctomycetota bacterium]|jgi:hypothetical protein